MRFPSMTMTTTLLMLLSLATVIVSGDDDVTFVTFVDDAGTSHQISSDATIVTGAMDAVALSHFGLDSDRIVATFGERSSSGSNHGGQYYDGNVVYADMMKHNETPYDPDVFPADPDTEERAYLDSIGGDLSSECSASNYYCDIIDVTYLDENDAWPDLIIVGAFYKSLMSDVFIGNATEQDIPIIILENAYSEDYDEESISQPRDMIEMVQRMEELALALGVVEDDAIVGNDKQSLCDAAKSFQATAQTAQDNGVRSMASYMPYMSNPQGMTGAFLATPDRDPVLFMMQNLGMPILYNEHGGDFWENRAGDYTPGAGTFQAENTTSVSGNVPYHVDFWLYDDRVSLDFLSEQFAQDWPHPALLAKQYAYWPSNARILSYAHAAEILSTVEGQLQGVERVTPATDCIPVDGTGGPRDLAAGEYSCTRIQPIDFCGDMGSAAAPEPAVAPEPAAAPEPASSPYTSSGAKEQEPLLAPTAEEQEPLSDPMSGPDVEEANASSSSFSGPAMTMVSNLMSVAIMPIVMVAWVLFEQ